MTGSTHRTRLETMQQFLSDIERREVEKAVELLSPGVSYHVLGSHALSGTFSGREEVGKHLIDLDKQTLGTVDAVKWDDWLVGEDHVAALADITMTAGGRRFTGRLLFLAKFDVADLMVGVTVLFQDEDSALRFFGPPAEAEGPEP
jgi:ketosteroid isomerase-like protein